MHSLPGLLFLLALLAAGRGVARAESAASLAHKGQELYRHEHYPESAQAYHQALERDPTSTILQYNYGTALAQQHQYEGAVQALQQAAQAPGSAVRRNSFFNLGVALADSVQPPSGSAASAPAAAPPVDGKELKQQVARLEQSLGAFRETILTDPKDDQAKYNYEVVQEMLRRLKQRQQQQQQQQQQQGKQNQQDKQNQQQNQQDKQHQQGQQNSQNQQQQNQQQQQSQQGQDQQQKQQARQNQGLRQQQPQAGRPEPQSAQSGAGTNDPTVQQAPKPLTKEQMDALRLLNLLEKDKPEQFKKLFRFQGKPQERAPLKDW